MVKIKIIGTSHAIALGMALPHLTWVARRYTVDQTPANSRTQEDSK